MNNKKEILDELTKLQFNNLVREFDKQETLREEQVRSKQDRKKVLAYIENQVNKKCLKE